MSRHYTVNVQQTDLPAKIAHLTSKNYYDYFAVKYLKEKYKNVCAVPYWFFWKVKRKGQEFAIPQFYMDQCFAIRSRFINIPMCLLSPEAPGGHANSLIIDRQGKQSADFVAKYGRGKGTVERFEPHGARAYEIFKDYIYEKLDIKLEKYFRETYGLEYIPPINYCPALGPQTLEHYITEDGYCATWSLWYTDMRLAYPDTDRETLVKGMFDKLHDKLTKGTLTEYLLSYARQVYAVMVSEFPHYRDFFINYDEYKKLPKYKPLRKAFDKFAKEMDNLVTDPMQLNKPVVIRISNRPDPIRPGIENEPVVIPPGRIYKKRNPKALGKKKKTPSKKRPSPRKKRSSPRKKRASPKRKTSLRKKRLSPKRRKTSPKRQ